jgi:hypothetical protein
VAALSVAALVPAAARPAPLPGDIPPPAAATYLRGAVATTSAPEVTDGSGLALPGGGRTFFPGRRLVALYGHPGAPALGVLGEQGVRAAVRRAERVARPYRELSEVPVIPAFELIATVAHRSAGRDGNYSGEASVAKLRPWVRAAARNGFYVLLDIQPGRADVLRQAKRYRSLLLEPHVGLAVDPEWKLQPGQQPLGQVGHVDARELNRTSSWLAGLVRAHDLPQKLFVVHQFRLSMIGREHLLRVHRPELAVLVHMDGQGSAAQKLATWRAVKAARPGRIPLGWKNFYDEDHPTFTPERTMARRPQPLMISYQ